MHNVELSKLHHPIKKVEEPTHTQSTNSDTNAATAFLLSPSTISSDSNLSLNMFSKKKSSSSSSSAGHHKLESKIDPTMTDEKKPKEGKKSPKSEKSSTKQIFKKASPKPEDLKKIDTLHELSSSSSNDEEVVVGRNLFQSKLVSPNFKKSRFVSKTHHDENLKPANQDSLSDLGKKNAPKKQSAKKIGPSSDISEEYTSPNTKMHSPIQKRKEGSESEESEESERAETESFQFWTTQTGLSATDFQNITNYFFMGNNKVDNLNRARIMGFQGGVRVSPGANIRLSSDSSNLGHNVHIGSFTYINGEVFIDDEVTIGPQCSITSNNHLFNVSAQNFKVRLHQDCFF